MKFYLDSRQLSSYHALLEVRDSVHEKIISFSELNAGWSFGNGKTISVDVVYKAVELYYFGKTNGFKGDAFPIENGGINLSFFVDEFALDIIINPNLKVDITYEKGLGQNYEIVDEKENADYADIYLFLNEIREAWMLSESFQLPGTITLPYEGFKAPLLLTQAEKEEYQLWTLNVEEQQQEQSVSMLEDSMTI
jgi:hypothetical protein